MSIPPNSLWRGCASKFCQPLSEEDEKEAKFFVSMVYYVNCRIVSPPLADIVYRRSYRDHDIIHQVFRWDRTPFEQVFKNGFQARAQENTRDEIYYDVYEHVHHGGRPCSSRRRIPRAFISTTLSRGWHPRLQQGFEEEVYRYEIYAPGGILVAQTLGSHHYPYREQHEVAFVGGIAPQYIRSAQLFTLIGGPSDTMRERDDDNLKRNRNFNPQQHPIRHLNLQRPLTHYRAADAEKQEMLTVVDADVTDIETYIGVAFRSSHANEAYLLMKDEYVLVNYAPGTKEDEVVYVARQIFHGHPSLKNTAFSEYGISCAFGSCDGVVHGDFGRRLLALVWWNHGF
ncbi:hypothetical protein ACLOJK_037633 [Asimina triloba]